MSANVLSLPAHSITCLTTTTIEQLTADELNQSTDSNFDSPTKRSFLNECIRQIYLINGRVNQLPHAAVPTIFNKQQIWGAINRLLRTRHKESRRDSLQRIKRQLFRENKQQTRKSLRPERLPYTSSQCYNYKAVRLQLGVQRIRRNYLDVARHTVQQTVRGTRKRKLSHSETSPAKLTQTVALNLNTKEARCHYTAQHTLKTTKYAAQHTEGARNSHSSSGRRCNKSFEPLITQKQYERQILTYSKVLEESVRSIYYMKALLNLMMDHEETVYV